MKKKSKTLLITGGLGGIGINIVKFFYKHNYNIILIDNKTHNFFSKVNFIKTNNFIKYYKINLNNLNSLKSKFLIINKNYKKIDVLINCAGIQYISKLESIPSLKWQEIININLSSSFYTTKYILPLMKKNNWGRIINIASVHGLVASENKSAYVASKHGLIGLTKAVALETAKYSITCNAICPGWVDTDLVVNQVKDTAVKNKLDFTDAKKLLLIDKQPNLKFISGNAISSLALYLCTDEASEITGSSLSIDGGWTAQ